MFREKKGEGVHVAILIRAAGGARQPNQRV